MSKKSRKRHNTGGYRHRSDSAPEGVFSSNPTLMINNGFTLVTTSNNGNAVWVKNPDYRVDKSRKSHTTRPEQVEKIANEIFGGTIYFCHQSEQ